MPKRKAAENCPLKPWESARRDCRERRFVQIGNSMLLPKYSEDKKQINPFYDLKTGEKYLYFCMVMEAGGRRDFRFPLSSAKKYGISNGSFRTYVETLIDKKLITRQSGKNTREANNYSFSSGWKAF